MQSIMFAVYQALFTLRARIEDQRQEAGERGATAVEYGLLVALIAAVIIGTVVILGERILLAFQKIVTQLPST